MTNEDPMHERMVAVAARVREGERLQRYRAHMLNELVARRNELAALRLAQRKEQRDVEVLEAWSLERVWASVTGKLEERLKAERDEAVAAAVRVDEHSLWVDRTEVYLRELDEALLPFADVAQAYAEVSAAKVVWLRTMDPQRAARIDMLSDAVVTAQAWVRELGEAIVAGQAVTQHLECAERILADVQYELPPRSKTIGVAAFGHLRQAHQWLDRLRLELADVGHALPANIGVRLFPLSIFEWSIEEFHHSHTRFERQIGMSLESIRAARAPTQAALQRVIDHQAQASASLQSAWQAYRTAVES